MPQTPYTPPEARVSDPLEQYQPKPLSVRRAAMCLWTSAALIGVLTTLQLVGAVSTADLGATAGIGLTTFALLGFVAEKIRAGRGWARWLFLVIYVVGSLGFMALVLFAPQIVLAQPVMWQASNTMQFALQTAALAFMFTRASREWFKTPHAATPARAA
jgi:hypothetical protein